MSSILNIEGLDDCNFDEALVGRRRRWIFWDEETSSSVNRTKYCFSDHSSFIQV